MMELHILPKDKLTQAAAAHVARLSSQAVSDRGRFTVALSGGSLPGNLSPPLVTEPLKSQIDWSAWHVFWADERCVPVTDEASNYRLAREYLFDHAPIPSEQIHPLDPSLEPAAAAAAYQAVLRRVFQPAPGRLPRFDLILLGLGEDGHTASLFPHHPLINETEAWVASILDSPKPPPQRITLTLPVLNNARQVLFLATGPDKADILARVIESEASVAALPAQMVHPDRGELHWFLDEAAAANLRRY